MTLLEWEQLSARVFSRTDAAQTHAFGTLTSKVDFRIPRVVGGEGRWRRVEWFEGGFGWVDEFVAGAGRRCDVGLEWRADVDL